MKATLHGSDGNMTEIDMHKTLSVNPPGSMPVPRALTIPGTGRHPRAARHYTDFAQHNCSLPAGHHMVLFMNPWGSKRIVGFHKAGAIDMYGMKPLGVALDNANSAADELLFTDSAGGVINLGGGAWFSAVPTNQNPAIVTNDDLIAPSRGQVSVDITCPTFDTQAQVIVVDRMNNKQLLDADSVKYDVLNNTKMAAITSTSVVPIAEQVSIALEQRKNQPIPSCKEVVTWASTSYADFLTERGAHIMHLPAQSKETIIMDAKPVEPYWTKFTPFTYTPGSTSGPSVVQYPFVPGFCEVTRQNEVGLANAPSLADWNYANTTGLTAGADRSNQALRDLITGGAGMMIIVNPSDNPINVVTRAECEWWVGPTSQTAWVGGLEPTYGPADYGKTAIAAAATPATRQEAKRDAVQTAGSNFLGKLSAEATSLAGKVGNAAKSLVSSPQATAMLSRVASTIGSAVASRFGVGAISTAARTLPLALMA